MRLPALGAILVGLVLASAATAQSIEDAAIKAFLDKAGGYHDKLGGYYDPKNGTYTDKSGGKVDNWQGYTYPDGSYKSALGDYFDAPTMTFKLSVGSTYPMPNGGTVEKGAAVLRDMVKNKGGYDPDFVLKSMIAQIKSEHPTLK